MSAWSTLISGRANKIAWWRLGESSGPTAVDETGSHNATYPSGVSFSNGALLQDDATTSVAWFGASDFTCRLDLGFSTHFATFSWEFLIRPDVGGPSQTGFVISKNGYFAQSTDDFPFVIKISPAGLLEVSFSKGDDYTADLFLTGSVTLGYRNLVQVVFVDQSKAELWINGAKVAEDQSVSFSLSTSARNWCIGAPSASFGGGGLNTAYLTNTRLQDVVFYSAALSASDIAASYAAFVLDNLVDLYAQIDLRSKEAISPDITAAIWLYGQGVDLSAAIDLHTRETVTPDLSAAINLRSDWINIAAAINLNTSPKVDLFAAIKLSITEAIDLSAAIDLRTDYISLSATIDLAVREVVSPALTAQILLQEFDAAGITAISAHVSPACVINGIDFSAMLTGTIDVEGEEDAAGLASVTIFPASGVFSLTDYVGKPIQISATSTSDIGGESATDLLFNGYVSSPEYDPNTGQLRLECTTDLPNALNAMPRANIDALIAGHWSPVIFEEGAQGFDYAFDQLRTVPASIWHSPRGIVITDWAAKPVADLEFVDADVIDGSIRYQTATRQDLLNEIRASFDYRFERLRQRTLHCSFLIAQSFCEFLINRFELPQRSMIESAAKGGGWFLQGNVSYLDLPPADYYRCFPNTPGSIQKYIGWGRTVGGYLLPDPDIDSYCWGAWWTVAKRWLQNVTERRNVTIRALQSQAGNGVIATSESYSLVSAQDVSDWVEQEDFQGTGGKAGFALVGDSISDGSKVLGDVARDATDDPLTGRSAADDALQVIISTGVTDLLAAHRTTRISFKTTFNPMADLTKTVRLNTGSAIAKGKVARVHHTISIENDGAAETEIELALSRHFGSGLVTPSAQVPDPEPAKPAETGIPTTKHLTSHIGGRTDSLALQSGWDGFFSNWIFDPSNTDPFGTDPNNPSTVSYPEQFICEYPEISGPALDNIELPATQVIDVEIPLDELTLIQ